MASSTPRVNLSDKIRESLEDEIVSGKLYAGCRIDEQELMERFNVSRTPAREALQQLATSGLVEMVPRQGAVAATLTLTEYIATLEILTELAGLRPATTRWPTRRRTAASARPSTTAASTTRWRGSCG